MSSGDPETRNRILEVTRRLMEKRRGKDVRLEDIAEAARISRQAIYMHFGSRSGLLIATARYLDEQLGLEERTRPFFEAESGVRALEVKVEWWANYMPDIYGLAKALLSVRDTDAAAAAAWEDRMKALYHGCLLAVERMASENTLAAGWTVEQAADFFWATISFTNWEYLTIERGWSQEQYIAQVTMALKRALVRE
jgi:AcrR family transcriptional regulator